MDRLPPEILSLICEFAHLHGARVLSVANCTLVNKRWCKAASRVLFRHIRVLTSDREKLLLDTRTWLKTLKSRSSLAQVQQLSFEGLLWNDTDSDMLARDAEDDEYWQPLAVLIGQLPALTRLQSSAVDHIPLYILEALHKHPNPGIRLHLRDFSPDSIDEPEVRRHDLALFTSPRLSTIEVYDSTVHADLLEHIVGQMVTGSAPGLENVAIGYERTNGTDQRINMPPSKLLHDQMLEARPSHSGRGQLKSLRLAGSTSLCREDLDIWQSRTDFSALQSLKLMTTNIDVQVWHGLIATRPFVQLRDLAVTCEQTSLIQSFLESVPLLTSLTLAGREGTSLSSVLKRHGPTLQSLSIRPLRDLLKERGQDVIEISEVQRLCPNLQEFSFTTRRTQGDADEIATYRALGTLRKLQNLKLELDASVDTAESPRFPHHFDDTPFTFPSNAFYGRVHAAFINSALDTNLARSIFQEVAKGKPRDAARLINMEIYVVRAGQFGRQSYQYQRGVHTVADELGRRSWRVMTNPRDDMPRDVLVESLHRDTQCSRYAVSKLGRDVEPTFRHIWPLKDGENAKHWRNQWSSLPLAVIN